jgi:AcrR family transcriptional regulator
MSTQSPPPDDDSPPGTSSPAIRPSRVPESRPGAAGGTRDLNRQRRTDQLSQAALTLFLERSIDAVTIDDITRSAGVAKGSFYRYFDSREALVRSLMAPIADATLTTLDACTRALRDARDREAVTAAFTTLTLTLAGQLLEQRDLVRLYLQESRGPAWGDRRAVAELSEAVSARAIEITLAARSHGMLRDVPPPVSALAVVGAAERLLHAWLTDSLAVPPVEAALAVVDLVLHGVLPRADPDPAP